MTVGRMMQPVDWKQVRLDGGFWGSRQEVNRKATIPLQYHLLRKGGAVGAHQWDWWDKSKGRPPWRIWVGDLAKWIEAASYSLALYPDAGLAAKVEEVVESIRKGQKKDGYLYPNPIPRDYKFANLQEYHELYELGHDMEGAVAHFRTTGKRHFLDTMCRAADLLCRTFGRGAGKKRGYDGHPEVELALVKLYRATGNRKYLELAKYFVDERGRKPNYFVKEAARLKKNKMTLFNWYAIDKGYWYCQAHKPLREQEEAAGHAVRALYLYSGMADVAAETGDAGLLDACRRLWRSVTHRRMYVTGGVGSATFGEAFSFDYDLPNETAYAETCANIALVLFAHRMLQIDGDSEYADVMERALYNGVLSGVGLDGRHFFYANHLTVFPQASKGAGDNTAASRQKWFGCACCPPNAARLLASFGQYVYSASDDSVFVHLYATSQARCAVGGGTVGIRQETDYPWRESVRIAINPGTAKRFTLALRVPGWCRKAMFKVNGVTVKPAVRRGYAQITRRWEEGDEVQLTFSMPVERVEANPAVRMNCGKVALQRGPVVYCLEEVDNGKNLADIVLPKGSRLVAEWKPNLLGGCVVIRGKAGHRAMSDWDDRLYRSSRSAVKDVDLLAVPYSLWANRAPGEMLVWVRAES